MKSKRELPYSTIRKRICGESLSEDQEHLFDQWIAVPQNGALYEELRQLAEVIGHRAAGYEPHQERGWLLLQQRIAASKQLKRTKRLRYSLFSVAAIVVLVLAIGVSIHWQLTYEKGFEEQSIGQIAPMVVHEGESIVVLPDGSKVWIEAGASLTYSSDFPMKGRTVRAEGALFFEVSHDANNAFVVQVDEMEIKVHGTRFGIEAFRDRLDMKVALIEGSVSLQYADKETFLRPGEEGVIDRSKHSISVAPTDTLWATIATQSRVRLENMNMGQVCRYLSKRYRKRIEVSSKIATKYAFTFTLRDESLVDLLQMMARVNPIKYEFVSSNHIVISEK